MTVVVEIADYRYDDVSVPQPVHDLGNGLCRLPGVDGYSNQLRSCEGQSFGLLNSSDDVRGIRVRHRLDNDGVISTDLYAANVHGNGCPSSNFCHRDHYKYNWRPFLL